jgi:gamma-glutamyl hercynylcysteine S-oxide synthase
MPVAVPVAPTRRALAELLAEARARTVLLVSPLNAEQLSSDAPDGLGSVLGQLRSVVQFEAGELLDENENRDLHSYDEWFDWMVDVRERVLQQLDGADLSGESPVAQRCRMVLDHEYRAGETILEVIHRRGEPYIPTSRRRLPRGRRLADPGYMVRFPGGKVAVGDTEPQQLTLAPFWIDAMPVTNGDYMTFMAEGGYTDRRLWSDAGWHWLKTSLAPMPEYWSWQDGVWWSRGVAREGPIDLTAPVSHISFYEAEAFASFVGKRLPTELEWEAAAGWDPETQTRRHYPWGNMTPSPHVANLDQLAFEPASVGAFPGNLSPIGCYGMIGDLWEWTASSVGTDHQVLRGGSWATRSAAVNNSVRRLARPESRWIFCGFRCARDV